MGGSAAVVQRASSSSEVKWMLWVVLLQQAMPRGVAPEFQSAAADRNQVSAGHPQGN
jgi:hypothetical protein